MAKGIPSFFGERLSQAREARGLTGVNLAQIVGLSPATITQYEHNATKPVAEVIERLGQALNVPSSLFFRRPRPRGGIFFYRSMSAATKVARTRAQRRYEWQQEIVEYFETCFDLPKVDLPQIEVPASLRSTTNDQIEDAAAACRRYWRVATGPMPNLVRLLEKNGFVISLCRLDAETLDAFSEFTFSPRPAIILGSDKESCVRSRFNAAHELAHRILHPHVEPKQIGSAVEYALMERQAHRFASAFLLPSDDFLKELVAPTLECFAALKERWKVAIGAMIVRCGHLGLVTEEQEKRLWMNMNRRGWKKREPGDDRLPMEQPKLLRQCVDMMLQNGFRSKSQITEDLQMGKADIEELAGLPNGYLSDGFGEVIQMPQFKRSETSPPAGSQAEKIVPFNSGSSGIFSP